jgi:hypothetical protein
VSAAAKLPTTLARMQRMRDQGVPLDARTLEAIRAAEAEALTVDDDEAAGKPGEVHRVADDPHAHDCGCVECDADRAAVGVDCGEFEPGTSYRQAVLVRKGAVRYRSRRATNAEPGSSDDWELAPEPRTAPATRPSTKAKFARPVWLRGLVAEIRTWAHETFATRADVELIAATKTGGGSGAELEARIAALEERLDAHARNATLSLATAYKGPHFDGQSYLAGSCVTHGGSLWIAMQDTDGRPGRVPDWRLAVKHGRDAREPR